MKYVVYPALAFVAALLFLPSHYSNGIRNLPLLIFIISCISLYYTVSAAKRVITLFKIRKRLIGEHMSIKRFSLVPNIFGIKEKYDIVAESRHSTVNIVLLMCRRSNLRYHFERPDLLEYYKGSKNSLIFRRKPKKM